MMKLTYNQRVVLRHVPANQAYWTSDIAHCAGVATQAAMVRLVALERKGMVQRVVRGNPTSWRITDAGQSALITR